MFHVKLPAGTSIAVVILVCVLLMALSFAIITGATWLVCYFWAIPFTWRIAAGACVIYAVLPRHNGK